MYSRTLAHTLIHVRTHTPRHNHKCTHTNTDTDATKQQQPKQHSDDNYCNCGVHAWRKCLWTAEERRGWSTVRWHHALNRQTEDELLQGLSRRSRAPTRGSAKTGTSDAEVESHQTGGCSTSAEKQCELNQD